MGNVTKTDMILSAMAGLTPDERVQVMERIQEQEQEQIRRLELRRKADMFDIIMSTPLSRLTCEDLDKLVTLVEGNDIAITAHAAHLVEGLKAKGFGQ